VVSLCVPPPVGLDPADVLDTPEAPPATRVDIMYMVSILRQHEMSASRCLVSLVWRKMFYPASCVDCFFIPAPGVDVLTLFYTRELSRGGKVARLGGQNRDSAAAGITVFDHYLLVEAMPASIQPLLTATPPAAPGSITVVQLTVCVIRRSLATPMAAQGAFVKSYLVAGLDTKKLL
jgi:hypothetical protein